MPEITERCGCGATFTASGRYPSDVRRAAEEWREQHRCTNPPAPGPCWHDSGTTWPGEAQNVRCELLAGHGGAHQATRPMGGTAVWPDQREELADA